MDRDIYSKIIEKINAISEKINAIGASTEEIGTLSELTTSVKTDLVNAINEVDGHADDNAEAIGTLANLDTTAKTNLVLAINELAGRIVYNTDAVDFDNLSDGIAICTNNGNTNVPATGRYAVITFTIYPDTRKVQIAIGITAVYYRAYVDSWGTWSQFAFASS